MAVAALIKFDQADGSSSPAGEAHPASFYFSPDEAKNVVTITNDDNTGVESWKIELLYNPPGSSYTAVPGTPEVLAQATSNTPSAPLTLDVPGHCYRVRLTVWDSVGTSSVDIRNVGVPDGRGFIIPPYQKLPDPLPLPESGLASSKPDELNFNGQVYGWLGDAGEGLHRDFFTKYDDLAPMVISSASYTAKALQGPPLYLVDLGSIGSDAVFNLPASGWRVGQRFRVGAFGDDDYVVTVNPPAGHTIMGLSSVDLIEPNIGDFIYKGGTEWVMAGAKYDRYERTLVAGVENTQLTGFQAIGSSIRLDPNDLVNATFDWTVVLETTDGLDAAEIRLYNVTLGTVVAGTVLSTTNLVATELTAAGITLASGPNLYEAQMRLQTTGSPNVATCRQAQIVGHWFQP